MARRRTDSPVAWKGPEIDYRKEMMHLLAEDEIAEIGTALKACGERDLPCITRDTFILLTLGAKLAKLRDDILDGRGVLPSWLPT